MRTTRQASSQVRTILIEYVICNAVQSLQPFMRHSNAKSAVNVEQLIGAYLWLVGV